MIEVKNISKSFGDTQILFDVSAKFTEGQVNLIIGASGQGKSVMTKCIVGLHEVDEGAVLYDGRDFSAMNRRQRIEVRKEIGMLFQGSALFDSLTVEELLFTANTLVEDENEKLRLFQVAEKVAPEDWRPANNVGYIYMLQNKLDDASTQFEKAAGLGNDPIIKCNLGVVARLKGNIAKAEELFNEGLSAGPECAYNLGLVYIKKGEYGAAIDKMGSYQTFNSALAKYLNGDTDGAVADIDASSEASSAMGHYLKAIVGARTNNKDMYDSNLKKAIELDSSLQAKADKDAEFVKMRAGATASE